MLLPGKKRGSFHMRSADPFYDHIFNNAPTSPLTYHHFSETTWALFSFNFLRRQKLRFTFTTKSWAVLIFGQMCVVSWSKINLFHSCCFLHKCEPFITCITQCQGGRDTAGETIFKHESDMLNLNLNLEFNILLLDRHSSSTSLICKTQI